MKFMENNNFTKYFLLAATMLGTSMVIGDGVLTPCISVLSAVGGVKKATNFMTDGRIATISVIILIILFLVQRFGTDKVGYSFAPILTLWFILIGGIGLFNLIKYEPLLIIKALNPVYMANYFKRNGRRAWVSLGGVVLCNTGVEALFADVGHFSVKSIRLSTCALVYPCLILAYTGQASYLRKNLGDFGDPFYNAIPKPLYWPMFIVAILSATIASQSMITGTFSIVQQSLALGCFPTVKVIHTSSKYEGQVYIPEVACVAVTATFQTTDKIGNAYGLAVVFVMTITSAFLVLIMILIWKTHILLILLYVLVIGSVELIYLSAVFYKFDQGGYLPLTFATVLIFIMLVWNYAYCKRYQYELAHKLSLENLETIMTNPNVSRIPGLALFYSELVQGVPPIFEHYVANVPALHSVLIFVSIKSLPISKVPASERFLFRRMGSSAFRCVIRYGYKDTRNDQQEPFDMVLVQRLQEFIKEEAYKVRLHDEDEDGAEERAEEEVKFVERHWRSGVVHLLGVNEVVAREGSKFWKRMVINYAYNTMKRNLRQQDEMFTIPKKQLLKVGMTIEI